MANRVEPSKTLDITMRDFRAAPAKFLRRASRTGGRLRIGDYIILVKESTEKEHAPTLYGAMKGTGELLCHPDDLLSTGDRWNTDD